MGTKNYLESPSTKDHGQAKRGMLPLLVVLKANLLELSVNFSRMPVLMSELQSFLFGPAKPFVKL